MTCNESAKCPNCESHFDVSDAVVAFPGLIKDKKISLVFALCADCYGQLVKADDIKKNAMVRKSYLNLVNDRDAHWAITSSIALDAHWGDFSDAWMYGTTLPKVMFDAINDGLVEDYTFLPIYVGGRV